MKIALLSTGRFHLCDLARELDALGHEVAFYSLVPPWRTSRFGLPKRCNRWLLPYVAPLAAAARAMADTRWRLPVHGLLTRAVDSTAAMLLEKCDVLIGMSNVSLRTMQVARRKYGAKLLIERGSRHILSQKEILENLPNTNRKLKAVPDWAVQRELEEYGLADAIVVPARHAWQSFIDRGTPSHRLVINAYGVDLKMFPVTVAPPARPRTILFVGVWSLQKGCDVLIDAWKLLGDAKLLHVGAVDDVPIPSDPQFEHYDSVSQDKLTGFYARAHVFALPSRQDGLALVQLQALASGLYLVCSSRTGGEDLSGFVTSSEVITVVPVEDRIALSNALGRALDRAVVQQGPRNVLGKREQLSWKAYAERYQRILLGM